MRPSSVVMSAAATPIRVHHRADAVRCHAARRRLSDRTAAPVSAPTSSQIASPVPSLRLLLVLVLLAVVGPVVRAFQLLERLFSQAVPDDIRRFQIPVPGITLALER